MFGVHVIHIFRLHIPAEKTIQLCPKYNRKCDGLMVIMGIVLFLMETIRVSTGM